MYIGYVSTRREFRCARPIFARIMTKNAKFFRKACLRSTGHNFHPISSKFGVYMHWGYDTMGFENEHARAKPRMRSGAKRNFRFPENGASAQKVECIERFSKLFFLNCSLPLGK